MSASSATHNGANAERPVTSKPRGICKYYKSARGCYQGDRCKFLHGETERLTPFDKSKVCRFHINGYCKRGDRCWFLHTDPSQVASGSQSSAAPPEEEDEFLCSICYDKPSVFGLLVGCSHVFCISCIKNWRESEGKSEDIVLAGTTKTCPMCRTSSRFVTPSAFFYPQDHPKKAEAIESYKASMARVKCKHFEKSPPNRRFCPFGKECFYKHENSDGSKYVFEHGAAYYMEHGRPRRRQSDHDFDFGGNGWDDAEENFELMLNTISRVFGNSQDMRRALRESMAAAFGSDAVPAMFRIDEEVEELEDDQVDDEDPDFILPSLAESIQSMPSLGEFDLALAEPSQLEEVDPDPVSQEVDETSTPSLIQSNLDPTIPAFVPSRLQPLRPPRVAPTPSYHLDRLRPLPVGLESSDAATPEEEHESIPADPSFSDFEPLTDAELDAVAPGTRSRRLAPSASLDATLRALGYTDHEEPGSSGTIQEAYRVMGIPRHEAVLPGSSLDIPPMPSVSLLDYSPVTSSSSPSVGNLTNATSTSTPSLDTPLDRPPSVQLPVPDATLVLNIDPPFVTDGRGHVVGSSLSSRGRRGRAASSSAAISPHPKVGPDALFSEDRDGDSCHGSPLQRPVSLVRQRSLPLVGASSAPGEDSTGRPAEFVTDGRGRVVYASSNPATSQCP